MFPGPFLRRGTTVCVLCIGTRESNFAIETFRCGTSKREQICRVKGKRVAWKTGTVGSLIKIGWIEKRFDSCDESEDLAVGSRWKK